MKRYVMVRGGKHVADVVDFGVKAVVQWCGEVKSTAVYDSMRALQSIHGHGDTQFLDVDSPWFASGVGDAVQSRCENAPFGDVGGLVNRARLAANDPTICPAYVPEMHRGAYLDGYRHAALMLYGVDWATCDFGWFPALTL